MTVTPTTASPPVSRAAVPHIRWLDVSSDDHYIDLVWEPPLDDGGSPIVGYSVVAQDLATGAIVGWRNVAADTRHASFPGLGEQHGVRVMAITSAGFGQMEASPRHDVAHSRAAHLPTAPSWTAAIPGPRSVAVHWSPAAEDGVPITGYTVVVLQDGALAAWARVGPDVRSYSARRLRSGVEAEVYVVANSAIGLGTAPRYPQRATPT